MPSNFIQWQTLGLIGSLDRQNLLKNISGTTFGCREMSGGEVRNVGIQAIIGGGKLAKKILHWRHAQTFVITRSKGHTRGMNDTQPKKGTH